MRKVCFLFLCLIVSLPLLAQSPSSSTKAYQSGEYLKYSLSYGWVTAGYATFSVKDSVLADINTKHILMTGRSAGVLEALYKIRDAYTSFVDPDTNQPVKSIRSIKEGRYKYYNEVTYDYSIVEEDSISILSQKSGEKRVPYNIQDILSAFYYGRNFNFNDDMEIGDIISFETYFGDELFPLRMKYMGLETVKTKYGKVECFLFHPVTEVGRSFKTEEDMKLWLSHDKNRIPVLIKMNLKIGSFEVELEEYKNLANPFSSIQN